MNENANNDFEKLENAILIINEWIKTESRMPRNVKICLVEIITGLLLGNPNDW